MLKRRLRDAGLSTIYSNHSSRAAGITNFLENGGNLEVAQRIAGLPSFMTAAVRKSYSKIWNGFTTNTLATAHRADPTRAIPMPDSTPDLTIATPKAFVSYAQSIERTEWIRQICERLIHDGATSRH